MRMDASGQPEVREKHIEQTEQIGSPRTDGYQCVHIGAAMLQLFPGAGEESPPQPEDDGSGQRPHDGIGIGHIHKEHTYDNDGHREDDGPGRAEFQCTEFLVVGLFRLFERVAVLLYQ